MSEFVPITTQEDFDKAIEERLKEERRTIKSQYSDYLSPDDVKKQYEGYLSPKQVEEKYKDYLTPEQAAEKDKKIKGYEIGSLKTRIARENNIPYELAGRLTGETEEDIKKDAEALAKIWREQNSAPLASTEPSGADSKRAAVKRMLSNLKED